MSNFLNWYLDRYLEALNVIAQANWPTTIIGMTLGLGLVVGYWSLALYLANRLLKKLGLD
jgi:hypothetical protein